MTARLPIEPGLLLTENAPMAERTTLRVGGPARFFAEVRDVPALQALLRFAAEQKFPLLALGKGSNLLIPDGGFPGVAFVLSGDFRKVTIEGTRVVAGGGASLMSLAILTRDAGLSGLEALSGIPSSIGGAIRINAGAYGTEIFDRLDRVELVTRAGARRVVAAREIAHGYRWTALMEGDDIIVGGTLTLVTRPREEIEARFSEVTGKRKSALPRQPNAGSIFKNPPGLFAGKLLQECGLKGLRVGDAQVSEVHANVIVNLGNATAAEVRALMRQMAAAVKERFDADLVPEVELVGDPWRGESGAERKTVRDPDP
jgi:UDP-N-acetylmuramate dehydrogenase